MRRSPHTHSNVKSIQRWLLSLRQSKMSMLGLGVCAFAFLYVLMGLVQMVVHDPSRYSPASTCVHCSANNYADNLADTSFEDRLCFSSIDIVYTWVNGSDPRLLQQLEEFRPPPPPTTAPVSSNNTLFRAISPNCTDPSVNCTAAFLNVTAVSTPEPKGLPARYRDHEELRYSFRSLFEFAPWVRNVYLVTNGQVPHWLNLEHPRLRVVTHQEIFPNTTHLPTFSSPSIEVHLHRIPGLSNQFIYFNDDVMFGREVWPDDFYTPSKGQKVYLAWTVPNCGHGCPDSWLGDGFCDKACNVASCSFDMGDCVNQTAGDSSARSRRRSSSSKDFKPTARYCASGCPNNWLGDKVCDRACKNRECGFDASDCGRELMESEGMFRVNLSRWMNETIVIPSSQSSFWVDLSHVFPIPKPHSTTLEGTKVDSPDTGPISAASHDNPSWVRVAAVTQAQKTMSVVFLPWDDSVVHQAQFVIEGQVHNETMRVTFNVTSLSSEAMSELHDGADADVVELEMNSTAVVDDNGDGPNRRLLHIAIDGAFPPDSDSPVSPSHSSLLQPQRVSTEQLAHVLRWTSDHSTPVRSSPDVDHQDRDRGEVEIEIDSIPADGGGSVARHRWGAKEHQLAADIRLRKEKELATLQLEEVESLRRKVYDEVGYDPDTSTPTRLYRSRDHLRLSHTLDLPQWSPQFHQERLRRVLMPWVVERMVEDRMWKTAVAPGSPLASSFSQQGSSRSLLELDIYGQTLRHVNQMYTKHFGKAKSTRRAPAHMPHFLDKRVMLELQELFPEEYDFTSRSRFRTPKDIQMAFAFMYYVMEARDPVDIDVLFETEVDLDGDGYLNDVELRAFVTRLTMQKKKKWRKGMDETKASMIDDMWNITAQLHEQFGHPPDKITVDTVFNTETVMEKLEEYLDTRRKYKHETGDMDDVEFYMVGNNYTKVESHLDLVRAKRPKFICLNDDMNKTHAPPRTVQALTQFFHSYLPKPSPFELPEGERNQFLHMDEVISARHDQSVQDWWNLVVRILLFSVAGLSLWFCLPWCHQALRREKQKKGMVII